ncbi:MAG TPA: HK97 gp10 family phage protein, partial [Candidatus Dwaynia gallinarum]|nr:HK97 gp10 family phage protein [Candidatus Dwaynia gallinarum]
MEIEGFEEFEAYLEELQKNFPSKMKKFSNSISRKVLKGAKDKTPVKTGKLKRKWKIDKSKVSTKEVRTIVKNTSPYAHLVEDGHIKKDKNKKIIGF